MFLSAIAQPAFAILGGYLIFYCAFHLHATHISALADKWDISYGLYLFAWPVQNTLITFFSDLSPWASALIVLAVSSIFGIASWILIESPTLAFSRGKSISFKSINAAS